jgi:tetratricopeptide (TPR) repeat protein
MGITAFRFVPFKAISTSPICISALRCVISVTLFTAFAPEAFALTPEAARESCRMSVGRPIVQSCMKAAGGPANLEACRAKATPQVRACMAAALNAAHGRANVAVGIPTEAAPKTPAANALPAGFVAPPRTITDITAILDSEKPDLKTIQELKAEADANPTGKESREDLAQFYFDRGNARAQLGRLADTIADANKAIEVGRGAITANMMGRLIQLAAKQYSTAGDPKRAFDLYQRQLREVATQKGAKGYQFGANRAIAGILIQMGDIAQAEGYLRRSQPLIQEARTSGHPGWR